jgi:hypothetical protein
MDDVYSFVLPNIKAFLLQKSFCNTPNSIQYKKLLEYSRAIVKHHDLKSVNKVPDMPGMFLSAVCNRNSVICKKILMMTNPKIDGYTFHITFCDGNIEIIRSLLDSPNFDPSAFGNDAIITASGYGHVEIVRLLLADERVDPSAVTAYMTPVVYASTCGHLEVVRLLLADKRVDPSARDNCAIKNAAKNGHVEIVRLLLADKRVDPSHDFNRALELAIKHRRPEIVKLLMSDSRVLNVEAMRLHFY